MINYSKNIFSISGHKIIYVLLAIVITYLQYVLWLDKDGIIDFLVSKKTLSVQNMRNNELHTSNELLAEQLDRFKKNPDSISGIARAKLGMIKKGETFYQFID